MSTESPLPDQCSNSECGRYLVDCDRISPGVDPSRSKVDPRFCVDCGDLFPSFQPRSCDYPFRIDPEYLEEGVGVSAEQCDNCGGSEYTIRLFYTPGRYSPGRFYAVCNSCEVQWPIANRPGRLIVW